MMPVAIYGWKCLGRDERPLLDRVNRYLAGHQHVAAKTGAGRVVDGYLPFVIKRFYWSLDRNLGIWFDIYPNQDVKGQYFFPDHKDCGWLIHVRIDLHRHENLIPDEIQDFIHNLLAAPGFEHRVLRESGDLHEGLVRCAVG